ncbi:putative HMG-box domain-containing protein 1 [Homarus americanus]|uniref:Putative HMG-box domain-containing protein 1 n=1 Tax=Homarus americanus TaxID=6706 RepID=A0A8J5NAS7_HOMAM|nr:putative HMG-box domain-containing protein 1 [Homarus americanus]
MILTRILWPQLSLTGGLLKTLYNTPCMLLVSCKRTVAEQLGIPEPPKGPKRPFWSFMMSHKQDIQTRFPKLSYPGSLFLNLKYRDFMFAASTKWNTLPDKEKNMYHKQAKVLEDQYQSELSKWEKNMRLIGREDLIHNHQQWVQLKASTTPNNGSTEVQVKPTAPKPAKAAVSSDTNKRFRRIVIIKRT